MTWPARVTLIDVGPRDGLQNEAQTLAVDQRVELIERLIDAGLKAIEFGSFVSPKAVPQMAGTSEVFARVRRRPDVTYYALVPNLRGYEDARAAGVTEIRLVISASEPLHRANFRRSRAESLAEQQPIIERAAAEGARVEATLGGCLGDPFVGPTPVEDVLGVVDAYYQLGIRVATVADTVGMATPKQVYDLIRAIQDKYPDLELGVHLHDTRNTGLANILIALEEGIRRIDAAIGGSGGCPFAPKAGGNVCTEDVAHMLAGMGIETGVDVTKLVETTHWLEGLLGHELGSKVAKAGPVWPAYEPPVGAISPVLG